MKFSEWLIMKEGGLADKGIKELGNPMKKKKSYKDPYNNLIPDIYSPSFEKDRGIATTTDSNN